MNGILPEQLYRWPLDGPPIAPSTVLWLEKPVRAQGFFMRQSQINLPVRSMTFWDPGHPLDQTQTVDTIVAPHYLAFVAPGLETRLYLNENGDLYAKQISGPNAGKSCNLTENKWL